MAININAKTSGAGGLETTADNTGNINIQSGGSTVMSVTSSGVAVTGSFSQNGGVYSTQPSFRNLIINGDMRIDQRNAGSAVTSATNVYLTDRWQLQISGTTNTPSFQQVTDAPTGFQYSLKATSNGSETIAANQAVTPRQRLEGFNVAHLLYGTANAKTITVSFWVKSSLTGTWNVSVSNDNFTRGYIKEYTVSSANTWEYKTVTIPGDTSGTWNINNTTGLILMFPVDTGTDLNGAANTWLAGNYRTTAGSNRLLETSGATFYVTGVQLEVGTTATDFENLPYDVQLQRCQRYYQYVGKFSYFPMVVGFAVSSTQLWLVTNLITIMRASPTVTVGGTALNYVFAPDVASPTTVFWQSNSNSGLSTAGSYRAYNGGGDGTSYFAYSAEL
jgi:stage V sporulation protein SpoVS